jgi:hypothetical protein
VLTYVFWITAVCGITAATGSLAAWYCCLTAGLRNGDRPGDAQVAAQFGPGTRSGAVPPGEAAPAIVVTVRNPSGTPVLTALNARRALLPALLTEPHSVRVPRWTGGRKFRPGRYETVGVAPAAGRAELALPAAVRARRCVLTVAVGQEGGRLRVHRLRLGPADRTADGRQELFSSARRP